MKGKNSKDPEEKFTFEDSKFQKALNDLCEKKDKMLKAEVLVRQPYGIIEKEGSGLDLATLSNLNDGKTHFPLD